MHTIFHRVKAAADFNLAAIQREFYADSTGYKVAAHIRNAENNEQAVRFVQAVKHPNVLSCDDRETTVGDVIVNEPIITDDFISYKPYVITTDGLVAI